MPEFTKSPDLVLIGRSAASVDFEAVLRRHDPKLTIRLYQTTEDLLRESWRERGLLAAIVEASDDAIIGRKLDGAIMSWNSGAERIFGYRAEEAIGRHYSFLVPPDLRDELEEICRKIEQGERIEHYESVRLAKNGSLVDLSLTVSPIKDARDVLVGMSVVGRDITARKKNDAERSRLVLLLGERVKELTVMYRMAHVLQLEGKPAIAMLEEIAALLPPAWRHHEVAAARIKLGCMEYKTPNFRPSRWSQRAEFTTADGRGGMVEVVYLAECPPNAEGPFSADERRLIDAVAVNLKAYSDRKDLESEILEISERVQRRIGQDLHDGLSQRLRGIAYLSHVLAEDLAQKSLPGAVDAHRITQLLDEAIKEAHSLAQGLSPISLEAEGLMFALKELASSIKGIYGISCSFACPNSVLVHDKSTAMNLFRIAQEGVQNAIKHGRAKRIAIRLTERDGTVKLAVADNGCGLPGDLSRQRGMGLKIMEHRSSMIGAELTLQRAPGGGTLLTCLLRGVGVKPEKSRP